LWGSGRKRHLLVTVARTNAKNARRKGKVRKKGATLLQGESWNRHEARQSRVILQVRKNVASLAEAAEVIKKCGGRISRQ